MGWIIWILTYALGTGHTGDIHALSLNPWFITLCFLIGSISFGRD